MNESVAVYVRVSTQEQATEGFSIGEQEERLKAYCNALKWRVYKVYRDAGYSGANTNRPGLQGLLTDIKARRISKVVVYKLDRLSRSQKDTLSLIEDSFIANHVDFVSMSENFDTSTPFGRAMIGILAVFAQLERETIRERVKMGKAARAKEGLYHGSGICPIGYRYEDGKLLINDFERLQIQYIFESYVSGMPKADIAASLNEKGMTHRYNSVWTYDRVAAVLRNQIYTGMIPTKNGYVPGKHEAIVTDKLYAEAQKRADAESARHKQTGKRDGLAHSYLAGILFCAKCGGRYGIVNNHNRHGQIYRYYACRSRTHPKTSGIQCDNKHWNEDKLNALIISEIKKIQLNPEGLNAEDRAETGNAEQLHVLNAEIARIDAQISRLMDLYSLGTIGYDAISERTNTLHMKRAKLEREVSEIEAMAAGKPDPEEVLTMVKAVDGILEEGNLTKIRTLIQTLIRKIEIDGEDITVHWNID